jgi:hypothetical protein
MDTILSKLLFSLKDRFEKSNKVDDALSQRIMLLNTMSVEVVSLNCLNTLYEEDADFLEVWKACKEP